ncbi:MAG TPA: VIT domain-containing protein [Myxococcota bacterium]|nr:VIT domain-containing protein [Myxococcota bacterium]
MTHMPSLPLVRGPVSRLVAVDGAELSLRAVHLRARAEGGYASVVIEQVFVNPLDRAVDVTYQLPLPADAAVGGFRFVLADEEVLGRVQGREAARRTFERALAEGRTAALLEQDRDALFTQRVGNVPAGAIVQVEVTLDQPLAWRDGAWEWRFPTVVAPRFVDEAVADADRLAVDVADGPLLARLSLSLDVADAAPGR